MNDETLQAIEEMIGGLDIWWHRCHQCSLAMIKTGLLPAGARVARGWRIGVESQHSWVVVGDPYEADAMIIDGTLWSYMSRPPRIDVFERGSPRYSPHGAGSIWNFGKPPKPLGAVIELGTKLSAHAQSFMDLAAPRGLDYRGWQVLANSPVQGWPASEIIEAMYRNDRLKSTIPIDIVGMLTDINPEGLYF